MAQLTMDDIVLRLADLNDTYDRFYKELARYNRYGILPDKMIHDAYYVKDHLANLSMVAMSWRDMAAADGIIVNGNHLSDRAAIVRITSRMPYDQVLSELTTAFNAMYTALQANEEMLILQVLFDFKPFWDDDDTRER